MIVQRTETHIIKETNPIYNWIIEECHRSKNLYNRALYIYRQAFTGKDDLIEDYKSIIRHEKFISSFGEPARVIGYVSKGCGIEIL